MADETVSGEPVSPCGVPKGWVGDYAESHSGLPPQTVFGAFAKVPKGRVGDYAESHSGLPPQTVFSGSERTWARFSPQIMRGIMRAVGDYAEPQ